MELSEVSVGVMHSGPDDRVYLDKLIIKDGSSPSWIYKENLFF